ASATRNSKSNGSSCKRRSKHWLRRKACRQASLCPTTDDHPTSSLFTYGTTSCRRLSGHDLQLGHTQRQGLGTDVTKLNLCLRVLPHTTQADHGAFAELDVPDAGADTKLQFPHRNARCGTAWCTRRNARLGG